MWKQLVTIYPCQFSQAVVEKQQLALTYVGDIEQAMVKGFPFTVPSDYDNLPQLKARPCLESPSLLV